MNVSSVKNLNGEVFSAVQDASLTNVVQSNSAQWAEGGAVDADVNNYVYNNSAAIDETVTTYEQNSASYLTEVPTGYAVESAFEKNAENKITAYNGTAFFAGGEGGGGAISSYTTAWYGEYETPYGNEVINSLNEKAISSFISNYSNNSKNSIESESAKSANYAQAVNETYLVNKGFARNLLSEYGTISVIHNNIIESTNSAISRVGNEGFVSAFEGHSIGPEFTATYSWDKSLPNTTINLNMGWSNAQILTYSANTDLTGEIVLPMGTSTQTINIPNATEFKVWTNNWVNVENATVSAAGSFETTVGELAWASALPTYEYDNTNKISAINGSALAGGGSEFDPTYMSANIDNKLDFNAVGFRKVNNIDYVSGISGKDISAKYAGRANTALNCGHANTASYDDNGNSLTTTYYNAQEAYNKANDLFNFVQSNSANWEGGSSPAGGSVLFHYNYSYDPNNGIQNRYSNISGANDLYFEASAELPQGTPSDIVITRYGSEIGRITFNQVSSDGNFNYFTAFYNNADGGEIGLQNNGPEYTCYVSANGAKTNAFNQGTYFSTTSNSVKFNIQGSDINGTIIGFNNGNGTTLTSFTGSLTDFTAKGYDQYNADVFSNDSIQQYYHVSAVFGEGGSSVESGDVFPPTNNLEPQTTYYLGWNANNGGLFWYHP